MTEDEGPVLLDTHVWIWLFEGSAREIPPAVRDAVRRAAARSTVLVSALSVWEVAMLESKGRLRLKLDCRSWIDQALRQPGVELAPFTPEVAVESTRLPGQVHGDPVDRILIATARLAGATLITRDRRLLEYGARGPLAVLDATP